MGAPFRPTVGLVRRVVLWLPLKLTGAVSAVFSPKRWAPHETPAVKSSEPKSHPVALSDAADDSPCHRLKSHPLMFAKLPLRVPLVPVDIQELKRNPAVPFVKNGLPVPVPPPQRHLLGSLCPLPPHSVGLISRPGENNCFLNAVVQCLWHCVPFRQALLAVVEPCLSNHKVALELYKLFRRMEVVEEKKTWQAVDPTNLRRALGSSGLGFEVDEMHDAAELLNVLCDCLHASRQTASQESLSDQVFGMTISEWNCCGVCNKITYQKFFKSYFHTVYAAELRTVRQAIPQGSFSYLLKVLEEQTRKSCDPDAGGCGGLNPVTKFLEKAPQVFTIQVAWELRTTGEDIYSSLSCINSTINLRHIYAEAPPQSYKLACMVGYRGMHYFAYVHKEGLWVKLDNTRITCIGSWESLLRSCRQGGITPQLLFYTPC